LFASGQAIRRIEPGLLGRRLPTNVYGNSRVHGQAVLANERALTPQKSGVGPDSELWQRFERFVREHHAYVLAHADAGGRLDYDLYPHRVWSNPALYRDFAGLDKRRIGSYVLVTDYVCVGYDEQGLTRRILGSDSRAIALR